MLMYDPWVDTLELKEEFGIQVTEDLETQMGGSHSCGESYCF